MIKMKATAELQEKINTELLEETSEDKIAELKKILAKEADDNERTNSDTN